jgi:16S rRNA (guanine(966)-N(2))-methyltransferase RsmD
MPRIIAGKAGGIPLVAPKGQDTRPTADKVKEALFSILMARVPDCQWLDLYAGTGQIGLEAVSRGAARAVLVEQARASLAAIDANLAKSGLADQVVIRRASAAIAVRQLVAEGCRFDVIFLDPPYRQALQDFFKLAPDLVRILEPDGLVVLEHESRETPADFVTELKRTRSCQYGTAMLSFYRV